MIDRYESKILSIGKKVWNRSSKAICYAGTVLLFLFLAFSFVSMRIQFFQIVRLLAFLIFGLLLPGYLLARKVARKGLSSELYAFSIAFGISFVCIFYFADALIFYPLVKQHILTVFGGPALSVLSVILLKKDKESGKIKADDLKIRKSVVLLLCVTVLISFCAITLNSGISAIRSGTASGYIDMIWNASNGASLQHGWPADYAQFYGKLLDSHYLSNLFRASLSVFVGCSSVDALFVYSPIIMIPFLCFSLDSLGLHFFKGNTRRSICYTFIFLFAGYISKAFLYPWSIFSMNSASLDSFQYGVNNLLYVPNGTDIAVPAVCLLVICLFRSFSKENKGVYGLISVFLLSATLTGSKYVFTVCVLGAMVGSFAVLLIRKTFRSDYMKVLIPLSCVLLGFILSYCAIVRRTDVAVGTYGEAFYYQPGEEGYERSKEDYYSYLQSKDYTYILISERSSAVDPVVRQDEHGYYYIGGDDLFRDKVSIEEVFAQADTGFIDTRGLIAGTGSRYEHEAGQFVRISNASGFIRIQPSTGSGSLLVFYGNEYIACENALAECREALEKLFIIGEDGSDMHYSDSNSSLSLNPYGKASRIYHFVTSNLSSAYWVRILTLILLIPVILFICRPLTAIPFVLWCYEKLKDLSSITLDEMLLAGTTICGLIVFFSMEIDGSSQMYFFLCATVFLDLAGAGYLFEKWKKSHLLIKISAILLVIIGVFSRFGVLGYQSGRGVKNLYRIYSKENIGSLPAPDGITSFEQEALEWLKDHSSEDSIIAINRHKVYKEQQDTEYPVPNSYSARYFYFTAYSERQAFIGGWAYVPRTKEMQAMLQDRLMVNRALFDPFCKNRKELMEANHISYLVAFTFTGEGCRLSDPDLQIIYQNRDVVIYGLQKTEKTNA